MAEPERRRRRQRRRPDLTSGAEPTRDGGSAPDGDSGPGGPAPDQPAPSPADLAPRRAEAETPALHDPEPAAPAGRAAQPAEDREAERGLRGLVGSGSSQVGPRPAMRARDASRPTEDDLAAAERDLVIIRRHWVPREELPRGR